MQLPIEPRWRGGELARVLDAAHARLVERLIAQLHAIGWETDPEYTFNHFGERGGVDVVGWNAKRRALALFEAKGQIVDVQDLLSTVARKARLVPTLLRQERGWDCESLAIILAPLESSRNRRVIAEHQATFQAAFPARTLAVRSWLASPSGVMRGIMFVPAGQRDRRTG